MSIKSTAARELKRGYFIPSCPDMRALINPEIRAEAKSATSENIPSFSVGLSPEAAIAVITNAQSATAPSDTATQGRNLPKALRLSLAVFLFTINPPFFSGKIKAPNSPTTAYSGAFIFMTNLPRGIKRSWCFRLRQQMHLLQALLREPPWFQELLPQCQPPLRQRF